MSSNDRWDEQNNGRGDPKKQDAKSSSDFGRALKKVGRVLLSVLMVIVILCCIGGCVVTVWVLDALNNDQQMLNLDAQKLKYTTVFFADDGTTELGRAYDPDEGNRIWMNYKDMPNYLVNCVISVEDKRFREHSGVDFLTTTKAGINAVLQKVGLSGLYGGSTPGASTITQQVVRNITGDRSVNAARKLREIFRALNLEKYYTKDQIMEAYLNLASFSRNCSGIESAANVFFGKHASELTVAECATIIGTTKNPTQYDPYTNFDANQERKSYILGLMKDQGYLTQEEYDAAMAQEIKLSNSGNPNATIQSWFMDYVTEEVCNDLASQLNITTDEAYAKLISGGYQVYTTCDPKVQSNLESVYSDLGNFPKVLNKEYPQSAFIITDLGGAVKGIVGSDRPKEGNRVWNRACDTTRQPGSTIKPISSYALSFEKNLITYSSVLEDRQLAIPTNDAQNSTWMPKNYYSGFKGYVTVQYAIMRSINTIPVQLTQALGTDTSYNFLKNTLKIDSLTKADDALSPMALGSLTNGVTPLKMAGAFQMFGNGGNRTEPYGYTRVLDSSGNVVLETDTTPTRVISEETATILNKLLQTVTSSSGTGAYAALSSGIPVAGKTGTTDDDVDQWFIGVTPYYVGVCWLGYDSRYQTDANGNTIYANGKPAPNSIRYASGAGYPPPILWKTVMNKVHQGVSGKSFPVSGNVVEMTYCTDTGMIAGSGCTHTATGWYKADNVPPTCTYHNGGNTNVPIVGTTSADSAGTASTDSAGTTSGSSDQSDDHSLSKAYSLQKEINSHAIPGQEITISEAIKLVSQGITSWDAFRNSADYQNYSSRLNG